MRLGGAALAATLTSAALAAACSAKSGGAPCTPGGDGSYVSNLYDDLASYCLVKVENGQLSTSSAAVEYDLNTPLFSDYAVKRRAVFVPGGAKIGYRDDGVFDMPVGTIIVKSFGFPKDFRDPSSPVTWIEARILAHAADGSWQAASYLWDDAQHTATQKPGGTVKSIDFIDAQGQSRRSSYLVPSINQCPKCHGSDGATVPIGLRAAQLNREHASDGGSENQLAAWVARGILDRAPSPDAAPMLPAWDDASRAVDVRARAYLEGNCACCHNPSGEARTTGLYLSMSETDPAHTGLCKSPVATGQASENLAYDIVPGQPDQSIVVHRMEATEPSIAMPEIGRSLVHAEAVAIVRQWIAAMPGSCK